MINKKSSAKIAKANDGVNVHYWHTYGPGMDKNTIVIHPGGGMNHSSLLCLEKKLNDNGHPTVLIEPRSCGYSQAPFNSKYLTLNCFSTDLQRIVEQEGLENPSLFAHSFGGMVVFDYAARTQNAKEITGACVSHNFAQTTVPGGTWIFGNILPFLDVATSMLTGLKHKLKSEERPYSDQSSLEGKSALKFMPIINDIPIKQAVAHFLTNRSLANWDVSEQLGNITVPIHLIHGYRDPMVMHYAAEMIKERAKGRVTSDKVPGDHTLPYSNPQKVIEIMMQRYEEDKKYNK